MSEKNFGKLKSGRALTAVTLAALSVVGLSVPAGAETVATTKTSSSKLASVKKFVVNHKVPFIIGSTALGLTTVTGIAGAIATPFIIMHFREFGNYCTRHAKHVVKLDEKDAKFGEKVESERADFAKKLEYVIKKANEELEKNKDKKDQKEEKAKALKVLEANKKVFEDLKKFVDELSANTDASAKKFELLSTLAVVKLVILHSNTTEFEKLPENVRNFINSLFDEKAPITIKDLIFAVSKDLNNYLKAAFKIDLTKKAEDKKEENKADENKKAEDKEVNQGDNATV